MAETASTPPPPPPPHTRSPQSDCRRCHRLLRRPRILLGVSGSVAAVKGPDLVCQLHHQLQSADVHVVLTDAGSRFWKCAERYDSLAWAAFQALLLKDNGIESRTSETNGRIVIHEAEEEWRSWEKMGDPVLHIDLRNWADVFLIAPLSAHTLAKVSNGLCDDTLSSVARAWKWNEKPVLLAPAMNTAMWENPLTEIQLASVQSFAQTHVSSNNNAAVDDGGGGGVTVIAPQIKTLACGDTGNGALASVQVIVNAVRESLLPLFPSLGVEEILPK